MEAPSDGVASNSGEPLAMTPSSSMSVAKLLKGVEKSYDAGKKLLREKQRNYDVISMATINVKDRFTFLFNTICLLFGVLIVDITQYCNNFNLCKMPQTVFFCRVNLKDYGY